jgi:arylsulfatase A-like enzyme
MTTVRNVLFVMCDQLRRDFVSCYGGHRVDTANIDRLAARGVRFDNAFVQAGVCGPARMSYYTGRYVNSHGATWNRVPLSATELTLGDYLRAAGRTAALAGKTHVLPDTHALARFGIEIESERGALLREGGFVVVDRYDGHTPPGPESGYADWLRAQGYESADPWSDYVISAVDGSHVVSGWKLRNAHLPARVAERHSETAYMTDLALDWIRAQATTPWMLHLSYVKPHWPYLAPAPFHKLFRLQDSGPILRGPQDGTADEHPVVRAYREHDECLSFAREDVVRHVRPTYMGLIAQVDYHLGRVLDALESMGRMRDTLIVFTSDHGEFAGDRGLGEKELLYDEIVRVPLIVMDPDSRADATRGKVEVRFAEGVDVLPTILESLGIAGSPHRVEGCSLLPLLRGDHLPVWRDAVFSELDYGFRRARRVLDRGVRECRAFMVRTAEWKYVHWEGFRAQLFDMDADPLEQHDLGADPGLAAIRSRMRERLLEWLASSKRRTTVDDASVEASTDAHRAHGVHIGIW